MEITMGPRIETPRLTLRQPEMRDAPFIAKYAGDYDIACMTALVPHPYPAPAAELWVLIRTIASQKSLNAHLIVDIKAGGEDGESALMGGMAGIFKRTADSDWEIGYWIAKPFWGKGYATEAGQALVDYARNGLKADRVIAGHYDDNPASGRVLEKLGFRYTGQACMQFSLGRMAKANCLDMAMEFVAAG
jgi:ribosomal-protein-alanine N-acetyltransferase